MKPLEILRRWKSSSRGNIVSALPFLGSIERDGEEFFQCGSLVVNTLNKVGECLKGRQFDELDRFYEETFSGSSLGLNCAEARFRTRRYSQLPVLRQGYDQRPGRRDSRMAALHSVI